MTLVASGSYRTKPTVAICSSSTSPLFFSFLLALSGPEDLVGKLPDDVGKSWRPMIQREAGSQPSSGGAPSPSSVSSCPPVPTYSYSAPRRRRFVSYFISIRPSWVISEETATSSSQIIYPTLLPGSRGHLYRHHLKRLTFKDAGLSFFNQKSRYFGFLRSEGEENVVVVYT